MNIARLVLAALFVPGLLGTARAVGDVPRLVGVWEAVRGDIPAGTTVEFMADHRARLTGRLPDGQQGSLEGTWTLEADILRLDYVLSGKARHKTFRIVSITDQLLLGADRKGRQEEFRKKGGVGKASAP